jgi:hypothetical protein
MPTDATVGLFWAWQLAVSSLRLITHANATVILWARQQALLRGQVRLERFIKTYHLSGDMPVLLEEPRKTRKRGFSPMHATPVK